jgi:hypothetical protein
VFKQGVTESDGTRNVRTNTNLGEQRALAHKSLLKGFSLLGGRAPSLTEDGKKYIRKASIHLYIFILPYVLGSTTWNLLHNQL